MKIILISALTLTIFAGSCTAEPRQELFDAVVTFIMNKVEKSMGTAWKPAKLMDEIDASMVLKTGNKSKAELNVNNKYRLMLSEDTLFVPALLSKNETRFELKKGTIFARIKKLLKNEKFTIMTPSLVIGVRGTDFIVHASENKVRLAVREGAVNVRLHLKSLETALKHSHPSVQAFARKVANGVQVLGFESVEFSMDTIKKMDELISQINPANIESQLKTLSQMSELIKTQALTSDFTEGLLYFSRFPDTEMKKMKPITLNAGIPQAEILINNEKAGEGLYARLFFPGKYQFQFKYKQFMHTVIKEIPDSDFQPETITAPFNQEMLRQNSGRRQAGYYEANPEDRAAN